MICQSLDYRFLGEKKNDLTYSKPLLKKAKTSGSLQSAPASQKKSVLIQVGKIYSSRD